MARATISISIQPSDIIQTQPYKVFTTTVTIPFSGLLLPVVVLILQILWPHDRPD